MAKIVVEVCAGTYCTMLGSMDIIDAVASLTEIRHEHDPECEIEVKAIPCQNLCEQGRRAPLVIVNGTPVFQADSETVMAMILDQAKCGGSR